MRPLPIRGVVVWYVDERRSCRSHDEWRTCPDSGVILVQVLYDKTHRGKYLQEIMCGSDYYWYANGEYAAGTARLVPVELPESDIKRGTWVTDPEYHRLYNEACEGVSA